MIEKIGYIKSFRKMLNWEWFTDVNTCHFFVYCLLRANYDSQRFMGVEIPRGSFVSSIDSMAMETGLTPRQIRTSIEKLIKTNEITKKATNKFTIINVVNYEVYQDEKIKVDKRMTNERQTDDKRMTTIKEDKKIRNKEYIYNIYGEFQNVKLNDDEYKKLVDEFGQDGTNQIIKILDMYKGSTGKKYKSDYLAIRRWVIDKYMQDKKKNEKNVSFLDL